MGASERQRAGGSKKCALRWLHLAILVLPALLSGHPAAATDFRCPIIMLPTASGPPMTISASQDLPDSQPAQAGPGAGSYGRESLADDFENSKPAPSWDRAKWLEPHSFALTSAGVTNGLRAMLLTVHRGDKEDFVEDKASGDRRCVERAEIGEAADYWPRLGDDLWYGFALYLPTDLPPIDRRLVLAQIKQLPARRSAVLFSLADGNPVLALRLKEIRVANILCLYVTPGNDDMTDKKPLAIVQLTRPQALGIWHNVVLHVRLSHGKSGGSGNTGSLADWWFDDQPVAHLGKRPIVIGYKDGGDLSYFKLGPYRDQAIKGSSEIDQDWTIGYDAVKREIGYPGRPGDPLNEHSVAPVPIDPAVSLSDTTACRTQFGLKS